MMPKFNKSMRCYFVFYFAIAQVVYSQSSDYPLCNQDYNFICYNKNEFVFSQKSHYLNRFYSKFDSLISQGKGTINIVHIGASHVQADQMTGRLRENLYNLLPDLISSRGLLFPYAAAKSNHPYNYYSTLTGNWNSCRNVESKKSCTLGIAGISASTTDTLAGFTFFFKRNIYPEFRFNEITVLHATGECFYDIELLVDDSVKCFKTTYDGCTVFETDVLIDTLNFKVFKTDSMQDAFELYGVIAGKSNTNGIVYNAIGVNGASVQSFLRCFLFKEDMALLKPDLVILSLGINDVQDKNFSVDNFEKNYDLLINNIKRVNPNVSIIITTNSDSYYKRKYPNKNSELAVDAIYRLIEKHENTVLWDWFNIMGGLGAVKKWEKNKLAKKDLVHFTKEGYFLIGDLFYSAFIKAYENYLSQTTDGR